MRNLETEIRSDRAVPAGMGPRFRAVPLRGARLGPSWPASPAKPGAAPPEPPLPGAARAPAKAKPLVVVCPAGTDPLVCEVANLQAAFSQVYEQQLEAWNYATAGPGQAKIASFAVAAAHPPIETQIGARHPAP